MDFFNKKIAKARSAVVPELRKEETSPQYQSRAIEAVPGDVRMFSGCQDEQTSADVSNVASFGLPPVSAAEKAGGACTNALLSTLKKKSPLTFGDLLVEMRGELKRRGYTQVPQLSTSHQLSMKEEQFNVMNPKPSGRTRALLIGINYVGQRGELSGCINDVHMMKDFIERNGYSSSTSNMRILTDDAKFANAAPTCKNVIDGMKWLVEGAQAGDSLFFHYSGHGGQMPDDDGDEEDGMDETLIPVDYQKAGQVRDDLIYQLLVAPLKQGVQLVAVFDCCHSGTILDLPYIFSANEEGAAALQSGKVSMLGANPLFNFEYAMQQAAKVAREIFGGVEKVGAGLARDLGGFLK